MNIDEHKMIHFCKILVKVGKIITVHINVHQQ